MILSVILIGMNLVHSKMSILHVIYFMMPLYSFFDICVPLQNFSKKRYRTWLTMDTIKNFKEKQRLLRLQIILICISKLDLKLKIK